MDMGNVWIVAHGVDTLVVNVFHTDERGKAVKRELDASLAHQLEEWKKEAQEAHEDVPTSFLFHGKTLHMCPNGAGRGQWTWMLKTRDITLYVSRGHWNGIATVRFSSEYLWSCGRFMEAVKGVQVFLDDLFHDEMFLQVSEVHLCADVAGWDGVEKLDRCQHFVSRSRKRSSRFTPDWGFDADVQRQMGHTTLTMTNHYASLTVQHLQKSHEKYSPMRAEKGSSEEAFGEGYWEE